MDLSSLGAGTGRLLVVLVSAVVAYAVVIGLTRLAGVRSLAKMSSFDFAATVAVGSTLSSALLGTTPLLAGVLGLTLLFGLQWTVGTLRRRGWLAGVVDNTPILLLAHGVVLEQQLRHARVSQDELRSQLRQAGVTDLGTVHAVVLETTGDVSVLRDGPVDPELLVGVRGREHL